MIVVTDTSPLRYLILLGCEELLPRLYNRVLCPEVVLRECGSPGAPNTVRIWAAHPPDWLEIFEISQARHRELEQLDPGERWAIELALKEGADAVLIDEFAGRKAARDVGLIAVGTIGILAEAARNGWIDYGETVNRLLGETNFRVSPGVVELGHRHAREK
jgi:predicted nucleic acid-binding protein